jgi:hypothetical protein
MALCAPPVTGAPQAGAPRERSVTARVDPRIELFSVIFRLAGSPEYNQDGIPSYEADTDAHFGPFRGHAAIALARELRQRRGVGYDAVMSIAIHTNDVETLGELVPLDPLPAALDDRWRTDEARAFLTAVRSFAQEARFDEFFAAHEELYALACRRMQELLDGKGRIAWFDEFFGERPTAKFQLALGVLNGGASYGPRVVHSDGREDLHAIIGVWLVENDLPVFDLSVLSTVIHEFCHSYCNHLVEAHLDALRPAAEKLWPAVASRMERQAYGSWESMMTESLVRASVTRYVSATRGAEAGAAEVAAEEGRGFLWTGALGEVLAEYEEQRDEYPTLEAYFPHVVEFFDRYAAEFDVEVATPPVVVNMVPANGAKEVDPGLGAIRVTFDRRMRDGSWAFVGGGPKYPEMAGKPSYDATRTTVTLPVKLEPARDYELWLNRGKFSSFRSESGVELASVHVRFRTREARDGD